MGTFAIIVFICALGTDPSVCDEHTAIDRIFAGKVTNSAMCGLMGQTTTGMTAIAPRPGKEYEKIVCRREPK